MAINRWLIIIGSILFVLCAIIGSVFLVQGLEYDKNTSYLEEYETEYLCNITQFNEYECDTDGAYQYMYHATIGALCGDTNVKSTKDICAETQYKPDPYEIGEIVTCYAVDCDSYFHFYSTEDVETRADLFIGLGITLIILSVFSLIACLLGWFWDFGESYSINNNAD